MVQIWFETKVLAHALFEAGEVAVTDFGDVTTTRTDEVVMGFFGRPFEDNIAGAHIGGGHKAHALEDIERAVHGTDVDEGIVVADLLRDLGGTDVPASVAKYTENQEPLGGELMAGPAEELGSVVFTGHYRQSTDKRGSWRARDRAARDRRVMCGADLPIVTS